MNPDAARHGAPHQENPVKIALIAIFASVASFGVFGGFSSVGRSGSSEPGDAIPKTSFLAATVDVAALRRSPVYELLWGADGKSVDGPRPGIVSPARLGLTFLTEACGFDPTTRVNKLSVAVPEEGNRGEFGLSAKIELSRAELETCANAIAAKRGHKATTRQVGSFIVLDDVREKAGVSSHLAYGAGGLLVAGTGPWFDRMLSAADGVSPRIEAAVEHASLRASLTTEPEFNHPIFLATAVLPRSLRDRLLSELEKEGNTRAARDDAKATMSGVLGVAAVGIAMSGFEAGKNIEARAELVCDDAIACEAVEKFALRKRKEWAGELALRLVGFGPVLDSIEVRRDGVRVRVKASASTNALTTTLERLIKLRGSGEDGLPPARAPEKRPPLDDEPLRAKDASP
jgi:hypothetical protein